MLSWKNRRRNDGIAITTRMTTGITVHRTSISVLWVVRLGVGLARALNFTITTTRSASTKTVIRVMSTSRKLWKDTRLSITGEADRCRPICQGEGWPRPAKAMPPAMSVGMATAAATVTRNRASIVQSLLRP